MEKKTIVLYELGTLKKEDKNLLNHLSKHNRFISVEEEKHKYIHTLCIFDEVEEEVAMVANEILTLMHKKTPTHKIKVLILNDDYRSVIKRVFSLYHIPFELKESKPLIAYDITKYFLFLLEEEEDVREISLLIRENYDLSDPLLKTIYDKLIHILNAYIDVEEISFRNEIIKYKCQVETVLQNHYENVVEIKHLNQDFIEEDANIFMMGASLSYFPVIHKDEDYLSDIEKTVLGMSTSLHENKKEEEKLKDFLNTHKHIKISYALFSSQTEYAVSSFVNKLLESGDLVVQKNEYFPLSKDYASYLLSLSLDSFVKYNEISKMLPILSQNISNEYKTYKNSYTPIKRELLLSYLDSKLILSYTSLENFYKCKFRFYLQHILKVKEENNDSIEKDFGNIVHQILETVFKEECDENIVIDTVISSYYKEKDCSIKEKFYIEKYKREIKRMLLILKDQRKRSSFVETYLEKEFYEMISFKKLKVKLIGKIDKVCTYRDGEHTYAAIIDYKTGTTHFDLNTIPYGLGMQLFLYYMLLKKKEKLSFGGVYLQNVMKDILPAKVGSTYEQMLLEAYKLDGFTIKNKRIVQKLDKEEENSYIKTIRFKKDGDFYFNARVLEEKTIDALTKFVENNINKAIEEIYNSNFSIDPKQIGFEMEEKETGCQFCSYRDICFRESKDIIFFPKLKNLEFLKGDVHE